MGKKRVARATELRPDLIILDVVMPRMDGLGAAQAINKLPTTVPIVLNPFCGTPEVKLAANRLGTCKVVDKTKPGSLISVVEKLLSAA
jgi:CheY-like chemotaxis protein